MTAIVLDILKEAYREKYSFATAHEVNTIYITLSPFVHLALLGKELVKQIILESKKKVTDENILEYYQYVIEYLTEQEYKDIRLAMDIETKISLVANSILKKEHFIEYIDNYLIDTGWTDLVLLKDQKIQLVEIKTTDKLHMSQIIQLQNIQKYLPYEIKIVRLKNLNRLN
ncbi:MAG: hypothetical protein PHQ93_05270 [Sulfurimonas sp.]|uniref:hypothetical protein n=1 Tax=Sulfurimonas sp. TaxID=2022749 RepID=UPI0026254E3B|nr:hypothetical protein [Sulfurimonas sp.]MDD5400581.1 hypothetical protein [Sulfurimonas sp.]